MAAEFPGGAAGRAGAARGRRRREDVLTALGREARRGVGAPHAVARLPHPESRVVAVRSAAVGSPEPPVPLRGRRPLPALLAAVPGARPRAPPARPRPCPLRGDRRRLAGLPRPSRRNRSSATPWSASSPPPRPAGSAARGLVVDAGRAGGGRPRGCGRRGVTLHGRLRGGGEVAGSTRPSTPRTPAGSPSSRRRCRGGADVPLVAVSPAPARLRTWTSALGPEDLPRRTLTA